MTPAEAVALLERHRDQWPAWLSDVGETEHGYLSVEYAGQSRRIIDVDGSLRFTPRAKARHGLSDAENARRIIAAAEKGYQQRLQQIEKQRQRKPLKRTGLKRGKGPERKAELNPANRKRKADRFEEDFGGKDRVLWGKARSCDTCGAPPPSQNSHVLSRNGRLGKAREMISQCQECHDAITSMDTAELLKIAARVYRQWLDQGGHELPSGLERHGEKR